MASTITFVGDSVEFETLAPLGISTEEWAKVLATLYHYRGARILSFQFPYDPIAKTFDVDKLVVYWSPDAIQVERYYYETLKGLLIAQHHHGKWVEICSSINFRDDPPPPYTVYVLSSITDSRPTTTEKYTWMLCVGGEDRC